MYINSINYFRGIAIMLIVFGHSSEIANFSYSSILGNTIFNLTVGGTSLFVFISGFLFHHIFYQNFEFKRFIIKKNKNVLSPYLILSTIPILYLLLKVSINGLLSLNASFPFYEKLSSFPILRHYLIGMPSFLGYWYIPFIMIVFAISPIFIMFIKLNMKTKILIVFFMLICSVFMHRGVEENIFSVFQNVIYFTPVYLLGMILSEKKDIVYSKFIGKDYYLLIFGFSLALLQVFIGKIGNYHKEPFFFNWFDLMIIQKIILCLFFMIFLHRFENSKNKLLDIIAENSFGIFFLHGIFIRIIFEIKEILDFSFPSNLFAIYLLIALLVFSLSLITTVFIKRIFPNYSRYLVGS
jgi:surface polysaccharide O-acyltransferase-like enzyme